MSATDVHEAGQCANRLIELWTRADDNGREQIGGIIAGLNQPGRWRGIAEMAQAALEETRAT